MADSKIITAATIRHYGSRANGSVRAAQEMRKESQIAPEAAIDARRLSSSELAEYVGASGSTIDRLIKKLGHATGRTGRIYSHPLSRISEYREALGTMRSEAVPVRIATVNFKGGVSKSTLTAHLAYALALKGYRALVVDADPQGSLSTLFGKHPDLDLTENDTLLPYFEGTEETLHYAIKPTELPNLSIIPAQLGLAGADYVIPARQVREADEGFRYFNLLDEGLKTVEGDFDVVLMDCPPSLSYLTSVVARAADGLVIPLRPSMPDFASSAQFLMSFGRYLGEFDQDTRLAKPYAFTKMVITQNRGIKAEIEMEKSIRAAYPGMMLNKDFPHIAAILEAGNFMRTLFDVSRDLVNKTTYERAVSRIAPVFEEIEHLIEDARRMKAEGRLAPRSLTEAELEASEMLSEEASA